MDKLKMHSMNKVDENIEKIGKLFPNCITERKNEKGEVEYAVDFDMLKQELSSVVVEGNEERYQFTWPDKKKSILLANAPIAKTLRPCREESVDFDNTENLYIEGDNLDVLKLLQETYLKKIKMIYIDPPYNTGNNLIYHNDFSQSTSEYLANSGQFDGDGNALVQNPDTNGRFHTDWLNMIYPRLRIAKDLLTDDGVLVCAIDENEVDTLSMILKEIFGESSYEHTCVTVVHNPRGQQGTNFSHTNEYALFVYPKGIKAIADKIIADEDVSWSQLRNWGSESERSDAKNCFYPIYVKDGEIIGFGNVSPDDYHPKQTEYVDGVAHVYPIDRNGVERKWRYARQTVESIWNMLKARPNDNGYEILIGKTFGVQKTVWADKRYDANEYGTKIISDLVPNNGFTFPKSLWTVYDSIFAGTASAKDGIILDFFSGSGTTAHAVMQINAEDGGNRKFIMVQLPEETDEKSEAYKAGYKNICEIGKERIRRAGAKIKEESQDKTQIKEAINSLCKEKQQIISQQDKNWIEMYCAGELSMDALKIQLQGTNYILSEIEEFIDELTLQLKTDVKKLDTGFRVLKLDSTNMKDVYYNPADYELSLFDSLADNIKEDRTPEDLLFQVMLDLGVLLSSKIEESIIAGKKVFNVADGFLYACFDENVTEDVITEIAKKNPYYFVMRDSSMANDSVATNFEQIFATYSPDTVRKVL